VNKSGNIFQCAGRGYLIFCSLVAQRNFARFVFRMAMPGQKGRRNYFLSLLTIFYDELFV